MSEKDLTTFGAAVAGLIRTAQTNQEKDDSDYVNPDDGLLYCGKCRTPKQCVVKLPCEGGGERSFNAPCLCECRKQELEEEKRRKQAQEEMAIVEKLKARSLMDEKFKSQTFDTFRTTKDNGKVLRLCKRYADGFSEMMKKNQGLLFYGDVGTGKTFAAACIANALLNKRIPVVMTSFVKLLESAQSFKEDEEKLIYRLNQAKLLIIDDLGAERNTDFALEKVYDIVDSRYRAKLPMILTTNLELSDMQRTSDMRYSRIYDRIFEVCYPVRFTGASFRKQEAKKRFDEMKLFLEGDDE